MEWKQLKMTANEQQKAKHLRAVEAALEGQSGRKFHWSMPLTVILTAVVLCFLIMAPGLPHQGDKPLQQGASTEFLYEKGYAHVGELGKMPSSILFYGVKQLQEEQLRELEKWLLTGKEVEVVHPSEEPSYEFGLMNGHEQQYLQVYANRSTHEWLVYVVDEKRWLEMADLDLFDLVHAQEWSKWRSAGIVIFGILAFGYMIYVEKVYMKNEEGRRRKSFGKLWHGFFAAICYIGGFFYIVWVTGAFIPIGYIVSLGGLLFVAYLDRRNPDFKYRKHQYSAHFLYILFFITMFSFLKTY